MEGNIKNKILIDTSYWIEFLNNKNSQEFFVVQKILEYNQVYTCDIIITEILSGAKNEKEYNYLNFCFSSLEKLEIKQKIWDKLPYYRFLLRKKGFLIAIPDLLIAILSAEYNIPLLTRDKHFKQIQGIVDFSIF